VHTGECFDARLQIPDWASPDYEDGNWSFALKAEAPRGELKICEAEPITVAREIKPVKIFKADNMYIYDFGINSSGVCRLKINGENGQEIVLQYFEELKDGKPVISNLRFRDCDTVQEDRYICKGGEIGEYTPSFTYHGFRYVAVSGITEAQATEDLLTYLEMYSNIEKVGEFSCSDETVNKIQEATVRSDYSNFW
jgi:alpha-L-rhamnosidase